MNQKAPKAKDSKPKNLSVRRKQASRFAAVRALYAEHFIAEDVDVPLDERIEILLEAAGEARADPEDEGAITEAPERALLVAILESAKASAGRIHMLIEGSMGKEWKMERLGPLLHAVITAATAELIAKQDKNPGMIINEYIAITESYFDDGEVSFVNGILATISEKIRGVA